MKIMIALAGIIALTGCATLESSSQGPTRLADGADAGMWSSRSPSEVSACLTRVQAAAMPNSQGQPLRFRADAADAKKTRYLTQVSIFGDVSSNRAEAEAAAFCL